MVGWGFAVQGLRRGCQEGQEVNVRRDRSSQILLATCLVGQRGTVQIVVHLSYAYLILYTKVTHAESMVHDFKHTYCTASKISIVIFCVLWWCVCVIVMMYVFKLQFTLLYMHLIWKNKFDGLRTNFHRMANY